MAKIIRRGARGQVDWLARLEKLLLRRRGAAGWLLAAGVLGVSVLLRSALDRPLGVLPFVTFAPAVALTTLLAGWQPACAVLVASGLIAWRYFLPPSLSPFLSGTNAAVSLAGFLFVGVLLIALIAGLIAVLRITVAQRERLRGYTSLQETRYQELQHRVANSLQAVSGILETGKIRVARGADATAILDQAFSRIQAAAEFQRTLVDQVPSQAGFEDALRQTLIGVFGDLPVVIELAVASEQIAPDKITPLLLLVMEAATNSMKYAFQPGLGTIFHVGIEARGPRALLLTIRDDGPGVEDTPAASERPRGFGLQIMEVLAAQLGGKLVVQGTGGTTIRVEFERGER